jgi:hypothetical protein
MTEVTKMIGAVTNLGLDQRLKQTRFFWNSSSFSRQYGQSLQVVNMQSSKCNSRESGKFTINIGVHFSGMALLLYGKDPMPKNPKEFHYILGARVGMLMNNPHGRWWTVRPETDVEATAPAGKPSDRWNCKNEQPNRVW